VYGTFPLQPGARRYEIKYTGICNCYRSNYMELILIFINYNETKSAFLNKIVESVLFESICKKWQLENRKK
jgi:hypothetical protein